MSRSVLVVDDEPNIVRSLEFLMGQAGYLVRVVHDGDRALEAVAEERPDLILLDLMLPKLDGYEVCRAIRENPDWRDIHIIMLTAKGQEVDRAKGIESGADDYITKPYSTRDLLKKVKGLLEPEEA